MAKSSKKQAVAKSVAKSRNKSKAQQRGTQVPQARLRTGTKQATAIEMLRSPGGTTIDALMKTTHWQQHSVRGFLAGVVRKRLKLNLDSTLIDGQRIYRVTGRGPKKVAGGQAGKDKS